MELKTRIARPGIYERPQRPLIDRYSKAYRVQSKDFEEFFRELIKDAKQPLDRAELRRLLAIGVSNKPAHIHIDEHWSVSGGLHIYLAGCLFLRSLYLHYTGDADKAIKFALNAIRFLDMWKYWPFELDLTNTGRLTHMLNVLEGRIPESSSREIKEMLEAFYNVSRDRKIQSEVEINPDVLEALAQRIRRRVVLDPLWGYTHMESKISEEY